MADIPETLNLGPLAAPDSITRLPAEPASPAARPSVPGYEVTGELGRGGMGVVYRARQEGLGREVALKMLLAGPHADEGLLARFRAEAEAVAKLAHPNIVQVFDVGSFQGQPYFSLELVSGGNLAERISGAPQPPRQAAELLATLAQAIDFAHVRGIVHRDLKPANVLLTSDGSPKISDFGLARRLEGGSDLTKSGEILGTPSYMSPEQAEGGARQAGPAADVWALGAILYELLTGRPPFRGQDPIGTLMLVCQADPVAPRQLVPAVPRDLETIALKCLEKQPRKRYSSARELAADLRRYLEGQPILARPAGALEIAWKWTRRRPAVAALIAVVLVAGVAFTWYGIWKNRQLADELARTEAARARAQRNFRRALGAAERQFLNPERAFAEELAFYDEVLSHPDDSPADQYEKALAARRAGDICRQLEEYPRAARYLEQASAYLNRLVSEFHEVHPLGKEGLAADYRRDFGATLNARGNLAMSQGEFVKAEQSFRQALNQFINLQRLWPKEFDYPRHVAVTWNNVAGALARQGKLAEAIDAHQDAIAVRRKLVEQHPRTSGIKHDLALSLSNLASVQMRERNFAAAETLLHEALQVRQQIPATDLDFEAQHALALARVNLAVAQTQQSKGAEAAATYGTALSALEKLSRDFPQSPVLLEELADTYANYGFVQIPTSKAAAQQSFTASAALWRQLVARYPQSPRFPRELARQLSNVGLLELEQGRPAEAEAAFVQSVAALKDAVAKGLPRDQLAKAADLTPLHGRADFRQVVEQ